MNSNRYIVTFILVMCLIAAVTLTGLREATKELAIKNEEIFNKRAVLLAVNSHLGDRTVKDLTDADVQDIFSKQVEQTVINMNGEVIDTMQAEDVDLAQEKKKPEADRLLPLFVFNSGTEKYYILSVRGKGLWDEIWGNIALEADLSTVAGASFDHKGETPGLGAEIKDNPAFPRQFEGKKLYNDNGEFVSITVRKGGARDPLHDVDGISGATVTGDGVTKMLYQGLQKYEPYLQSVRKEGAKVGMN